MDKNLIYEKTPAGEEAMRHRTRLVQRHLRMVLILVDGKTSVAQLCEKIENTQLVESALEELEKGAFVAPLLEQPSVWDKGVSAVQKVKEAAVEQFSTLGGARGDVTPGNQVAFPKTLPESEPMALPMIEEREPSLAPEAPLEEAPPSLPKNPIPARASWLPRLEEVAAVTPLKLGPQEVKGRDSGPSPWSSHLPNIGVGRLLGYCGLGLVAGLLFLVLIYPYDRHRSEAEALLTGMTGQVAKIEHLGFQLAPRPGLVLESVSLGDSKGIHVARIRVRPNLGSLGHATRIMEEVEMYGTTIPLPALLEVPRWLAAGSGKPVRIAHMQVSQVNLELGNLILADLAGDIFFNDVGEVNRISLQNPDHSVKLEGVPRDVGLDLNLETVAWTGVGDSLPPVDSLSSHALLTRDGITLDGIDARFLGGLWQGQLTINWSRAYSLEGNLIAKGVAGQKLSAALKSGALLEGELAGNLKLSATGSDWQTMLSRLQGEGSFSVARGVLGNINLAEAVRRSGGQPVRGGETHFEQLGGRFRFDPQGFQLSDLQFNSGLLQVSGKVGVDRTSKLDGVLDVRMRQVRVPLAVRGSLADPLLQSGRR